METCCIYTEAKDRKRYTLPDISGRYMSGPYLQENTPPTPPFCAIHMKQSMLDRKKPIRPIETKDLRLPNFRVSQKQRTYSGTGSQPHQPATPKTTQPSRAATRTELAHGVSGNLCRCQDYNKILTALMRGAEIMRSA